MKLSILFASATFNFISVWGDLHENWEPPRLGDVRSPCPMLNTLANHGILPRDGKDITENDTINALGTGLNFEEELSRSLHQIAITTNPTPNATMFSLDHLSRHNIIEHDASLSREDAYFGDPAVFNHTVFDETRAFWTGPIVDLRMAALSRLARLETSKVRNPSFTLNEQQEQLGLTEDALYLSVIGDITTATALKSQLEYFFENERLPFKLGWSKPHALSSSDIANMLERVVHATEEVSEEVSRLRRRRSTIGIHPVF
ncbi:Chloroperoxidase [Biscogniauxia marginata]|nr:Chloroperoxidase [Biscogniauxia marginata]